MELNYIEIYFVLAFLGNKESDWIKLQQFRTKGQQWYRFDLGNTVGYVPWLMRDKTIFKRLVHA